MELIKNKSYKNEYIDIVYNKSNILNVLIKELFEYTHLDSYYIKLNLEKINIVSLIQQLIAEHMYFFEEKNVKVEFENIDNEINCLFDIKKIIRVIDNIIKIAENIVIWILYLEFI